MPISRRKLIAGVAGGVVAAAGAEWWTLRGNLDHRRSPGASGADRYAASLKLLEAGAEGVVHIGHSTHLVSLGGLKLLTDPWFYDPAFGALSHSVVPAVRPSQLGSLDAILISHDHADHADLRAIAEMDKRAMVIVNTEELGAKIRALGFGAISVLARDQETKLGPLTIRGTEAIHDIYEVGYLVMRGSDAERRCIYFAGDTALHGSLGDIGQKFKPQISILPCDGTRLTGGALHVMRPEDAVEAAGQLGSRSIVPSHAESYFSDPLAGTLLASTEPRAAERLAAGITKELPAATCHVPLPGELIAV